MDNADIVRDQLRGAVARVNELVIVLAGADEGVGATHFSRTLTHEVRAAYAASERLRTRLERLSARIENAGQRHDYQEANRAPGPHEGE